MLTDKDTDLILHPFTAYRPGVKPIAVVKGEGARLYDEQGNMYIDAIGSWWVNVHGHAHPYINQRVTQQMHQLEHVMFSGFTHAPAVHLAEKVLRWLDAPFRKLFYSDNGSTAVEVALKMAVHYWMNKAEERNRFIAFRNGYHGDTFGAMSVSERDIFVAPYTSLLFDVDYIDLPTEENIASLETEIQRLARTGRVAAFIAEPLVQGAAGMRMYAPHLLDRLFRACHNSGILIIADEVMTGFGRTGKPFAIDHLTHKPDFICLSKGLTGGYLPLGITAFTEEIAAIFAQQQPAATFYHGHSFTANPLSCTAALASMELMELPEFDANVQRIETAYREFIPRLRQHPLAADVRTRGLILAVDVELAYEGYFYLHPHKHIMYDYCMAHGVVLRPLGNVLYMIPPVCITDEELQHCFSVLMSLLHHLQILEPEG